MARNINKTAPSPGQPLNGQGVLRIPRLKIVKSKLRICTWDVITLFQAGKLDNLVQEMKRMNIYIRGISEHRWPGYGSCRQENGTLYYAGSDNNDQNHRGGVGIFVSSGYPKYIKNFVPISNRICLLQMVCKPFNINLIQVYAPTAEKRYEMEVEKFYELIDSTIKTLERDNITIALGDFNAKID